MLAQAPELRGRPETQGVCSAQPLVAAAGVATHLRLQRCIRHVLQHRCSHALQQATCTLAWASSRSLHVCRQYKAATAATRRRGQRPWTCAGRTPRCRLLQTATHCNAVQPPDLLLSDTIWQLGASHTERTHSAQQVVSLVTRHQHGSCCGTSTSTHLIGTTSEETAASNVCWSRLRYILTQRADCQLSYLGP